MIRYFHLLFGVILVIVFLITGQFMAHDFPDKDAMSQELRILMRSRHIYLLFSAFLHLLLGVYFALATGKTARYFQIIGSGLLVVASVMLVWAFFAETYTIKHFSNISRYGIFASLAGVIFHLFGGSMRQRQDR